MNQEFRIDSDSCERQFVESSAPAQLMCHYPMSKVFERWNITACMSGKLLGQTT